MTIPVGVDSATGTPIYFTMPPLEFDLFEPAGDTVAERPSLFIYIPEHLLQSLETEMQLEIEILIMLPKPCVISLLQEDM